MKKCREEIISVVRKKGVKSKLPRSVVRLFVDMITTVFQGSEPLDPSKYDGRQQKVIYSQQAIGYSLLPRGYLSVKWYNHLKFLKVPNPERRIDSLLQIIWEDIFDPLWGQRNSILHEEKNKYNVAEDKILSDKLIWYVQNKHALLAYQDHFLAKHDLTTLHRMRRATKREWIRHLDRARQAYENEQKKRASDQNVITRYFQSRTATAVGAPDNLEPD